MGAPSSDWFAEFMTQEQLPDSFRLTFDEVCWPLADRAVEWREDFGRMALIGLCGAQGSGKSTVAAATVRLLQARGLNAVAIAGRFLPGP